MEKYEKARRLKNKVAKIREDYTAGTILNINNLIH
jgi:hypothetical protein